MHTITERTPKGSIIHYSPRKIDVVYRHVDFKYKDKARYKEVSDKIFTKMCKNAYKVVEL